jgi:hypothetical protein
MGHQFLLLLKDVRVPTYVNIISQISDQLSRPESNRRCKRIMQLLRGSERDLKLDVSDVEHTAYPVENGGDDRAESLPAVPPQPAIKVVTLF